MFPERPHLLVVDDDAQLLTLIQDSLEAEGYTVITFADALPVLRYLRNNGLPHLALIDLRLPSMHGFELSQQIKALGDVPIMFITSEGEPEIATEGLNRYAEDFVRKPFDMRELSARIHRILLRLPDFSYAREPAIQVDERLAVDFGNGYLLVDGRNIVLTPTEAGLLHILMRNTGRTVSAETLIARVWPTEEVYEDTLRVHMHRLRRKIEPDFRQPRYIHTERGLGYRFGTNDEAVNQHVSASFVRHRL
jgi:DNA-binding response OmpR family regulator